MLLYDALHKISTTVGDQVVLVTDAGNVTYAELNTRINELSERLVLYPGVPAGVCMETSPAWVVAVAALDKASVPVFLLNPRSSRSYIDEVVRLYKLQALLNGGDTPLDITITQCRDIIVSRDIVPETTVTILTSGTTGKPKAVQHTWKSLSRPVRLTDRFSRTRWLIHYPSYLYAGLQVFLQCILNAGELVISPKDATPEQISELLLKQQVEYVSATPSYWRHLLTFGSHEALRRTNLIQITLGGEVVTQELLDQLKQMWPQSRIVHIYATSELGRCFAVTDGREGFPTRFLECSPEKDVFLRIIDGELQVRSANHMLRYAPESELRANMGDWFATGDMVEVSVDRVLFRGRKTDIINVGGSKVHPLEVETVIRQVHGVIDVRVYPITSSLVGELVAVDVQRDAVSDPHELRQQIVDHCAVQLNSYQRPRSINILDAIALSAAGKVQRRKATAT